MIITTHEAATGTSISISRQLTIGNPRCGNPPATGPSTSTPRASHFHIQLAAIVPTTANSGPGHLGKNFFSSSTLAITPAEIAIVNGCASRKPFTTSHNCSNDRRECVSTPSICPSTAIPT